MEEVYSRFKQEYITPAEMNDILKYVVKYYKVYLGDKPKDEYIGRRAYISDKQVYFHVTFKKGSQVCTYTCRKDGEEVTQAIDGGEAFRIMSMYYKVPRMPKKICGRADEGGLSASPILYYNPKYEGRWIDAWGYDLNSAYSYAMLQPIPDTSVPMRRGNIIEGKEIGFEEVLNPKKSNELTMLVPKFKGYSLYVFPLMESPFEGFVKNWYKRKNSCIPGSPEYIKAKGVLNYSIGMLQRKNPFIRATIIGRCNNYIEQLIDEDTLFCNTDSIVSRKQLDLNLGTGIGEWKLEHRGKVAYKGFNYQWDDGDISYRHITKSWFPKGWDITKDPVPKSGNAYYFNKERLVLQRADNEC